MHTPGPWEAESRTDITEVLECISGETVRIDRADDWQIAGEVMGNTATIVALCDGTDAQANARLIAAAPDLLEACEKLLAAVNCNYCNDLVKREYGDMVRAALAKAAPTD